MLHVTLSAICPIVFGLLIGWLSGKYNFIKKDYSQAFADYIVKIGLPIALFLAAAKSSPHDILNLDYLLALAAGLILSYILGFLSGKYIFRHAKKEAAMQALSVSFPDMAYCGPPVLLAVVGSSGLIAMVLGNLIYTVIIIPFTLLLVSEGSNDARPLKSILKAVSQPLVILPILGAILAIIGVKLPEIVLSSVGEIGKTAGGVALFFLGLLLSKMELSVNFEIIFNIFIKNIVQGAIILAAGIALGLKGVPLKSAFIIGILPTATAVPALAITNKAYAHTAAATVLLGTLCSLLTIALGIIIIQNL